VDPSSGGGAPSFCPPGTYRGRRKMCCGGMDRVGVCWIIVRQVRSRISRGPGGLAPRPQLVGTPERANDRIHPEQRIALVGRRGLVGPSWVGGNVTARAPVLRRPAQRVLARRNLNNEGACWTHFENEWARTSGRDGGIRPFPVSPFSPPTRVPSGCGLQLDLGSGEKSGPIVVGRRGFRPRLRGVGLERGPALEFEGGSLRQRTAAVGRQAGLFYATGAAPCCAAAQSPPCHLRIEGRRHVEVNRVTSARHLSCIPVILAGGFPFAQRGKPERSPILAGPWLASRHDGFYRRRIP